MLKLPPINESNTCSRRRIAERKRSLGSSLREGTKGVSNCIASDGNNKKLKLPSVRKATKEEKRKKKKKSCVKHEEEESSLKTPHQLDFSFLGLNDPTNLLTTTPRAPVPGLKKSTGDNPLYAVKNIQLAGNHLKDISNLNQSLNSIIHKGSSSITSLNISQNCLTQVCLLSTF